MDKLLKGAAALFFLAAASILIQISWQVHRTPDLTLKIEAAVDYTARAAKNFDDATRVWKSASQRESDLLGKELPTLTNQLQQNLQSLQQTTDTLNHSVASITTDVHNTTQSANGLLASATRTTDQVPAVLTETQQTLAGVRKTTLDVDTIVAGPVVTETMQNIAESTANIADGTQSAAGILKDGRKIADDFVAPKKWYQRVYTYGIDAGKFVLCFTTKVGCSI
jgi:uncharacterized protein YoxC